MDAYLQPSTHCKHLDGGDQESRRGSARGFIENKYEKAVECLTKDCAALLAFYDFPAEHWKHLRTTNPIESTFATVRYRTIRSKGCLSNKTALAMIFKLAQAAEKVGIVSAVTTRGVKLNDEIEVVRSQAQTAAA